QHNLLVWLPPDKFERTSPHWCVSKVTSRLFHLFLRHHGYIVKPQEGQARGQWLFQNHAESITIQCLQALHTGSFPFPELRGSLNMLEDLGYGQQPGGSKETSEGIDHILRRHLSTIVKLDPLAQGEGPHASIPRSLPKLGKSGYGAEIGIKLNEPV